MQKAKFGWQYINERTPSAARWVFRTVLYMAATVNLVLSVVVEIPPDIRVIVGKYSLYAVTLVHAVSKMWGIPAEGPQPDFYRGRQGNI